MRVPITAEAELAPSQRPLHDAFAERVGDNYSVFRTMRDDGALLGLWSAWIQVPRTGEAIRQFIEAVEAMPALSKKAVQVATLVTGAHFNAAYELYAHAAVGVRAGLSDDQIATLCAGQMPDDLDAESTLVAKVAARLLKGGVLPGPLYKRAVAELGSDGMNHLVYVVAQYCLVSITLNAFDIPSQD